MEHRQHEAPRFWFRSERFFRCNNFWYFHTREGIAVGPYRTRAEAEVDARLLVERLRETRGGDLLAVIRDFIMGMGGELDYVNDPAFTNYVVSESWSGATGGKA